MKLSRFIYFFILISLFSCRHDLERTNPLDPNNPDYMPPEIALLSPVGGEEVLLGSTIGISWSSINVSNVNIELFKDDVLFQVLTTNLENNFSFQWEVIGSNTDILGSSFKIRITSSDNSDIFSQSNNNFTIYQTPIGPNADITLSKPISSIYIIGSTIEIAWNSTVITGNIGIYLVPYGLSIGDPIAVVSSSTTTYDWYIDPQNVVAGSSYRIRLVSTSDPSVYDESGLFQLTDNITPSIIVNYLNGPFTIDQDVIPISWDTNDINTGSFMIDLLQNGQNVYTINSAAPANPYNWAITTSSPLIVPGDNYTIKVTWSVDNQVYGESNPFSLLSPVKDPRTRKIQIPLIK